MIHKFIYEFRDTKVSDGHELDHVVQLKEDLFVKLGEM